MKLFISPHDDDSTLFGAFTLLRERPLVLVVFDSYIQPNRGEVGCEAWQRAEETRRSCKVLGCPVARLGIRDSVVFKWELKDALQGYVGKFDKVYIPALQGGNIHHDIVHEIAKELFGDKVIEYTTYTRTELWTKGNVEVVPTIEELEIKNEALACYKSQINLPATSPHFDAVYGRSEWFM